MTPQTRSISSSAALVCVSACALGAIGAGIAERAETIDTSLFTDSGDELRTVEVSGIIQAPPDIVFEQIATMDGVKRWLGIESHIELAIGGAYEWIFDRNAGFGSRGTEGTQILGYVPDRMLCLSWNVPPELKRVRGQRSWVTFLIEPVRGGSRVTIVHTGFGDTPGWDSAYRYYDEGWPVVFSSLRRSLSAPSD